MNDAKRLELISEAVRYCQRVKEMGMPPSCYTKALREPIHFLWERRAGTKIRCARYRSKAAIGLRFGKKEVVYDHAVPFSYLQRELLSLDPVNSDTVATTLERFGTIVLITNEENALLNAAGYGCSMPANWDETDPLARYKQVGIEIVDNAID
jgi:hypothetical protein